MTENNFTDKKPINASEKIDIIQVLRGIAVVMVIIFHFKDIIPPDGYLRRDFDFFFNSGAAGVDLFFVISGFIMVFVTRKLRGGISDAKIFLLKRLLRIWPLYIIATVTYMLVATPNVSYISLTTAKQVVRSILFIPLTYVDPPYFGYAYLGVGWSLNYEMYFYLLIAISLLAGKFRWIFFASLIFSTLLILPWIDGHLTSRPMEAMNYDSLFLNLITNPIIWEFIYGVIIGLLYVNSYSARLFQNIFQSKTLVFTVITITTWQYLSGFYGGHGPFNWGLSMSALFMALVFYNRNSQIQCPSWLVYLGDMSFSVYLWHVPVSLFITNFFSYLSLPTFSTGTPAFFLTITLTLVVSHLSYQLLEKKLHALFFRRLKL